MALSQPKPMGFALFGHVGNMCDVSNLELIEEYGNDPRIEVILVYLEGVKDGREFVRVAGRVTKNKPVLVLKVGRTEIGSKAALSHTGTLAGTDAVYSGAFKQCGVVRANTMHDLIAGAKAISMLPKPRGNRVCILTEAGGLGVVSMDEVEAGGVLELAPMSQETCARLTALLPPMAMVCKPNGYVDMTAAAMAKEFGDAMRLVLSDPSVDMVVLNSIPPTFLPAMDVAQAIVPVVKEFDKPVAACFTVGQAMAETRRYLEENGIPTFDVARLCRARLGDVDPGDVQRESSTCRCACCSSPNSRSCRSGRAPSLGTRVARLPQRQWHRGNAARLGANPGRSATRCDGDERSRRAQGCIAASHSQE